MVIPLAVCTSLTLPLDPNFASLPLAVLTLVTLPVGPFVTSLPVAVLVVVAPVFESWVTDGVCDAFVLPVLPVLPVCSDVAVLPLLVPELEEVVCVVGVEVFAAGAGLEGAAALGAGLLGPVTNALDDSPSETTPASSPIAANLIHLRETALALQLMTSPRTPG
jgi:hypothetical protein